jgi:hypothetical protein
MKNQTPKRAYRGGFCDGILGRPYINPYSFKNVLSMWGYFNGFYDGKARLMQMKGIV